MKNYSPEELKVLSFDFAEMLRGCNIPFTIAFYPNEESEPFIQRDGEMQAQLALLDSLSEEIHDEAINVLDENVRFLDAAQKKIETLERRN